MKLPFRMLSIVVLSFHLAGCNVPLGSYPYFWDYNKAKPRDEDLVGTYRLLKLRLRSDLERTVREKDPIITLRADHTVVFTEVPKFDGFGQKLVCRLSGPANWALDEEINSGWGWPVAFQNYHPLSKPLTRECDYENSLWGVLVLSRYAPYRLYAIVGDPDSDSGVEFQKVSR